MYSVAADGHLPTCSTCRIPARWNWAGRWTPSRPWSAAPPIVRQRFGDDDVPCFRSRGERRAEQCVHVPDDGTLKLDNPVGLSTTVFETATYLLVAERTTTV